MHFLRFAKSGYSLSSFCIGFCPGSDHQDLPTAPGQIFIDDLEYSNINNASHFREGRGTLQEEKIENSHSWEIQYELS